MLAEEIGQRPHIFGVAVQAQVCAAFQQHQPFGFAGQRVQDLRMFRGNDLVSRAVQEQDGNGRDLGDIALGGVGIAQQQRAGEGDFVVADFGIGSEGGFDGDGAHACLVARAYHGNGVGAAQALPEHEQLFLVHIAAGADIIQGGVAVVKQPLLAGRAAGLAVAAVVEQEDVVALCGQVAHGGPVGGQVLRVAVEMDHRGAGGAGSGVQAAFGRALRGHEPAVQRRAVFAGETDVFVPQALSRGRAVIVAVGIIKRVLRAG